MCDESMLSFSKYHLPNTIVDLCSRYSVTDLLLDGNHISTLKYLLSPTGLRNVNTLRKLSLCHNNISSFLDLQLFQHSRYIKHVLLCDNPICDDPALEGMLTNLSKAMNSPITFTLREPIIQVNYEPLGACLHLVTKFNSLVNEGDSSGLAQLYTLSEYVVGKRPGMAPLPPSPISWVLFLRPGEAGTETAALPGPEAPAHALSQTVDNVQPLCLSPDVVIAAQQTAPSVCVYSYADAFLREIARVLQPSHVIDFQTWKLIVERHEVLPNIYLPVGRGTPPEAIPKLIRYTFVLRGLAQEHARHKPSVSRTFQYVRWYVALAPFTATPLEFPGELRIVSDLVILAEA